MLENIKRNTHVQGVTEAPAAPANVAELIEVFKALNPEMRLDVLKQEQPAVFKILADMLATPGERPSVGSPALDLWALSKKDLARLWPGGSTFKEDPGVLMERDKAALLTLQGVVTGPARSIINRGLGTLGDLLDNQRLLGVPPDAQQGLAALALTMDILGVVLAATPQDTQRDLALRILQLSQRGPNVLNRHTLSTVLIEASSVLPQDDPVKKVLDLGFNAGVYATKEGAVPVFQQCVEHAILLLTSQA